MKIEIKEPSKGDSSVPAYPCIKTLLGHGDLIVLFISPGHGIALRGSTGVHYSDAWAESVFEPFVGSITISN